VCVFASASAATNIPKKVCYFVFVLRHGCWRDNDAQSLYSDFNVDKITREKTNEVESLFSWQIRKTKGEMCH
jgi:hypothetical protein